MDDQEDHEMNVYGESSRESLMRDDEISPEEEAFMKGYEESEESSDNEDDSDYENSFD